MANVLDKTEAVNKREKRAKSIAAMGLVNREEDFFRVSTPSLRGRQTSYEVRRDEDGKIICKYFSLVVILILRTKRSPQ